MSAESGPSAGGSIGGGFSAGGGGEGGGIGTSSIGGVGTISSGGMEMGSISSGASFAISTSESPSFTSGPELSGGSEQPMSNFAGFESFTSDPSTVSFDTPYHGDLSFLNPSMDLSQKSLATIDANMPTVLSDSDNFISGLLADLDTDTETNLHSESLIDTQSTEAEEINAVLGSLSDEEIGLLDQVNSILDKESNAVHLESMDMTDIIATENTTSVLGLVEHSREVAQDAEVSSDTVIANEAEINSIRAELDALTDLKPEVKSNETVTEKIDSTRVTAHEEGESTTSKNVIEITDSKAQSEPEVSQQTGNTLSTDSHVFPSTDEIQLTDSEVKSGAVLVTDLENIGIPKEEAASEVVEILGSKTYVEKTFGKKGEEQVVIQKKSDEITISTPHPVVDEDVNEKRKDVALEAITQTISDVQDFLKIKRGTEVPKTQIWVSGKAAAEAIQKEAPISGMLKNETNRANDGSINDLAQNLAKEWITLYTAPKTIKSDIANSNAVNVALTGTSATPNEVDKVINGKRGAIIYAPRIR